MKVNFYVTMVLAIIVLFGAALLKTTQSDGIAEKVNYRHYERLSYEECARREQEVIAQMPSVGRMPERIKEPSGTYYAKLKLAYGLIGSANRAMYTGEVPYDPRYAGIVRSIPVEVHQRIDDYSRSHEPLFANDREFNAAQDDLRASGMDPIQQPSVETGIDTIWWWLLFQLLPAGLLMPIHYMVQLRKRGARIDLEVFLKLPVFVFWCIFWEIGLFRYPHKVNPIDQLRRARQWAMLVLSSSLSCSCFGATGKVCESHREQAPQYQPYKGFWPHFTFTTGIWNDYLGVDDAVFHPAPVIQSSITISLPCGFYFNVWNSEPLGERGLNPNFGREFDGTGGWADPNIFAGISMDVSATALDASPIDKVPRGDVLLLSLRSGRRFILGKRLSTEPHVFMREAMPLRGGKPAGGFLLFVGSNFSWELGKAKATANVEMFHDPGAFGYNEGFFGRWVTGLTWKGPGGMSWTFPAVTIMTPLAPTHDGRRTQAAFGATLTFVPAR